MQAESAYHAHGPMDRLYNAITLATKSSEASVALSLRMGDAIKAEERQLKELRVRDKKLKESHTSGVDTADVLQGALVLCLAFRDTVVG